MSTNWSSLQFGVAEMLFERGAMKVDLDQGFRFDFHTRDYSGAPPSPCFFSLRTPDNPGAKQGNLLARDVQLIARATVDLCVMRGLVFKYVAGLPHAGSRIAEEFAHQHPDQPQLLYLGKEGEGASRRIFLKPDQPFTAGAKVLVLDDLVSRYRTKLAGVRALRVGGLAVTDIVVLINYGLGGESELIQAGITLHSVFMAHELFTYAIGEGHINTKEYNRLVDYPDELRRYIAAEDLRRSHI